MGRLAREVRGRHALITGGSSGIGIECAKQLVEAGARVTIVARNKQKLREAEEEILSVAKGDDEGDEIRVCAEQADVSSADDIAGAVRRAEERVGEEVSILICCAGIAECKTLEDSKDGDFERLVSVNYLGTVYTVRSCLPSMKRRGGGSVVLVSSQAGQVGLYGYTGYSASKFALQGFAQALEMECRHEGISVGVCYPPDTDTPQYAYENKTKPEITKTLVGTTTPVPAGRVAAVLLRGMVRRHFTIAVGFDGWALGIATGVMSPPNSFLSVLRDLVLLPILKLVSVFTLLGWHQTIRRTVAGKKNK